MVLYSSGTLDQCLTKRVYWGACPGCKILFNNIFRHFETMSRHLIFNPLRGKGTRYNLPCLMPFYSSRGWALPCNGLMTLQLSKLQSTCFKFSITFQEIKKKDTKITSFWQNNLVKLYTSNTSMLLLCYDLRSLACIREGWNGAFNRICSRHITSLVQLCLQLCTQGTSSKWQRITKNKLLISAGKINKAMEVQSNAFLIIVRIILSKSFADDVIIVEFTYPT